jgi:hypothetical protein
MDAKPNSTEGRGFSSRLLEKLLMPIVATAAGAAATYAAKKGPQLLDEKVVPRMRELVDGASSGASGFPAKAKDAAGEMGDVAEQLAGRARSAAGDTAAAVRGASGSNGRAKPVSPKELERRQRERAAARAGRRTATR